MIFELGDIYNEYELEQACLQAQPLDDLTRLFPAIKLARKYHLRSGLDIAGTYGLLYVLTIQDKPLSLAQAGLEVAGKELVIVNSPQGFTEDKLEKFPADVRTVVLQELKQGIYRDRLLETVIQLGRRCVPMGVRMVKGFAAENHPCVTLNGGSLALEVAQQSMDLLYQKHGFNRSEEGDYFLTLSA